MFFRHLRRSRPAVALAGALFSTNVSCHSSAEFDHSSRYDPRYFMADAAARVAPSVVRVISYYSAPDPDEGDEEFLQQRSGSGFIVSWQGKSYVVTNAHTIPNIDRHPDVRLVVEGRVVPTQVQAFDTKTDLAVLTCPTHPPVALGNSLTLRPGESVLAIGAPLNLTGSVTHGVVSALHRSSTDVGLDNEWSSGFDYIQVDAPIHEGNSGGPLVNCEGQVVGLNAMTTAYGVSWALPIEDVMEIVNALLTNGFVSRPFLGIQMKTLTGPVIADLELVLEKFPPEITHGVIITVTKNTPASRAGLRNGDVIVAINGKEVHSDRDIVREVIRTGTAPVELQVARAAWASGAKRAVITAITLRPDLL